MKAKETNNAKSVEKKAVTLFQKATALVQNATQTYRGAYNAIKSVDTVTIDGESYKASVILKELGVNRFNTSTLKEFCTAVYKAVSVTTMCVDGKTKKPICTRTITGGKTAYKAVKVLQLFQIDEEAEGAQRPSVANCVAALYQSTEVGMEETRKRKAELELKLEELQEAYINTGTPTVPVWAKVLRQSTGWVLESVYKLQQANNAKIAKINKENAEKAVKIAEKAKKVARAKKGTSPKTAKTA